MSDEEEIGATAGKGHAQILKDTLGRERGLGAAAIPMPSGPLSGRLPDVAPEWQRVGRRRRRR